MQLTTFCLKQLRITLLRVCAMHFIRIYLSVSQRYNTNIFISGRTINKEFDTMQGLKLRKYFRGQVGPHQINLGSPHNLLGAHQVRLPPRLRGAL